MADRLREQAGGAPRIAVVTGANRGIGHEVARQLAARGDVVVLGSRDPDKGAAAAAALAAGGITVLPRHLDVTDPATLDRIADELAGRRGRLDILVSNAAILYDTWQRARLLPRRPARALVAAGRERAQDYSPAPGLPAGHVRAGRASSARSWDLKVSGGRSAGACRAGWEPAAPSRQLSTGEQGVRPESFPADAAGQHA
jgi:NAD(P)-dependent dehydrogenase (short-subunit alcohol dehydrogenase family)